MKCIFTVTDSKCTFEVGTSELNASGQRLNLELKNVMNFWERFRRAFQSHSHRKINSPIPATQTEIGFFFKVIYTTNT
ncbi:hypothetical protein C1X27_10865 [Pseudomonas sp. MPR-AND1B]|nr:hypothetical protein C1X26_15530 [Pseudomonas sp. MPR-R3A]PMY98838.1 hypothetical protein C1X24_07120 [Pseudomonas sp. FW305-124]PMZ68082.1 hypothetical protein C1X25_25020 [Pseudomonas sp. GW247-3R2A]PNA94147.1 hypothetical protein C1X23_09370 [Pseudomonas sp. FW300-E2]PNB03095.1 hypothetical protein C1X27_10865 [Pseudomonas sp. MPR-AND1B]